MENEINLLHLSDIHFGYENEYEFTLIAQRENVLNALMQRLKTIEKEWKPDMVVISGDIGWNGTNSNYEIAKIWIDLLLSTLDLSSNELVLCVGNHDIDRKKTIGMGYTKDSTKADEWLKFEGLENYNRLFENYSNFCDNIKLPHLKISDKDSYLVGVREIGSLRFIVLNSAWFCRGKEDKDKLWIGLPQLELMNSKGQTISGKNYDSEKISIAVIHHTSDWLNENENNRYSPRPNTYSYLAERSHIILSGHSHGEIKKPSRMYNRAFLFTAGATYADKYYRNNFSILKINTNARILNRKSYEYNSNDSLWEEITDQESYLLKVNIPFIKNLNNEFKNEYDYLTLIKRSKELVQQFIDNKSKAITRTQKLPGLIERKIAWHSPDERIVPNKKGELHLNTHNNISTLSEMVSTEKPTFLFGELGSGKSTLVGQYIINLTNHSDGILPLLIPASFFSGKEVRMIKDIVSIINEFVNGQIAPTLEGFDLLTVLQQKTEVTLVIDGFDELDKLVAQNLLTKVTELRDNWAGLRIIATGRPIELAGLNYRSWQCLAMFPLTNQELNEILINEALADGLSVSQANEDSKNRMRFLNDRPELLGVTTTPLSIRLIRPYLNEEIKNKSLGDLIYDIILERLGSWEIKDSKETTFSEFKKYYPNAFSRETILGIIANEINALNEKAITQEQLFGLLFDINKKILKQNIVTEQAAEFFGKCILQIENDKLTFPSQPLLQGSLGIYIYDQLVKSAEINLKLKETNFWREYSFAATIARRKNKIPTIRMSLINYIKELLKDENLIPAVAIIVSESEDEELAKYFLNSLKQFEFRPLRYFQDIKTQSVRAIAHSIYLAGELGFDWFYEEYLNPKYPFGNIFENERFYILQHWFTFTHLTLSPKQKEKLTLILNPHLEAKDWSCHELPSTLVMVLPELFNKDEELLMYVANIDSNLFNKIAIERLRKEYNSENKYKVLNSIEVYLSRGEAPKIGALKLWLELTDKIPPREIIRGIILKSVDDQNTELIEKLKKRIKEETLKSILRFYLFLDSKIAAASAICLYRMGERDFYPIATGLLQGLHDGGKIEEAEKVLHKLIISKGIEGLAWLIYQFPLCGSHYGAHSAYWRIVLSELNKLKLNRVDLFSKIIPYLGEFILPRYPEIRNDFKKLFLSKPDYRKYLEQSLSSIDNNLRYNSACILLACFPESEYRACLIIIKSTTAYFERHEWWRFCLRLSLGNKVLDHINSIVLNLLLIPKTFALTLLFHNNYKLSSEVFAQLIFGLLAGRARFDDTYLLNDDNLKKILAQNESYDLLIKYLHNDNIEIARNSATALLSYHKDKLSDNEYGISWGLTISEGFSWKKEKIDIEIKYIYQSHERFLKAKEILFYIQKETNQEPLASLYLRSTEDVTVWKDILWSSLFLNKRLDHSEIASSCMWLFQKARKDTKIAQVLGKAAIEFIDHPSLNTERMYNDVIPWLIFIAHEYGNLQLERIESTLEIFQPISNEIQSTLIARLGYSPSRFRSSRDGSQYLVFSKNLIKSQEVIDFQKIVDATRDSEEIHKDLIDIIEETLSSDFLSLDEFKELSIKSKFGTIFSIIILFCRNEFNQIDWLVKILGAEPTRGQENNRSANYLLKAFQQIIATIENNPKLSEEFFKNIKDTIDSKNHDNIIELYKILLLKQELFESSYLTSLFSEISERSYEFNLDLANNLITFFLKVDLVQIPSILFEIKKIVSSIDGKIELYDSEYRFEGLNKLLFSLSVFYFQQKLDDESCNLFLKGLEYVFINYYAPVSGRNLREKRFRGKEILQVVSPLMSRVNPSLIRECLNRGINSEKPEIISICTLLTHFNSNTI